MNSFRYITIALFASIVCGTNIVKELAELIRVHTDDSGQTHWPQEVSEQHQLALALYGRALIASFDYWMSFFLGLLDGTDSIHTYSKHSLMYKKYFPIKEGLAAVQPESRYAVRAAAFSLASGVLFSSQVTLDQLLPQYHLRITLHPSSTDDKDCIELKAIQDDLHDCVAEWIWNFSAFAEELIERSEDKTGVSYRIK